MLLEEEEKRTGELAGQSPNCLGETRKCWSEVKLCRVCQSHQVPLRIHAEGSADTGHGYESWGALQTYQQFS